MVRSTRRGSTGPKRRLSRCARRPAVFARRILSTWSCNNRRKTRRTELQTTLDFRLNEQVERILRERLAQLRDQNVRNGAAVIIDNATGDVVSLVGSENYFAPGPGQVNGAWAQRSAGSTLKPFTYLLALERGATPATMVADVRTSFPFR